MSGKRNAAVKGDEAGAPSFEDAMNRLEQIVADMERGTLNLEDMIARFEEGQKLLGLCTHKLNEVEKKVEMLVKKGDKTEGVPFATDVDGEAADDPAEKEDDPF